MKFTRKKSVQKEYEKKKLTLSKDECFICDRELLECEFEHWVLLRNRYPYSVKFLWWDIPVKNHYLLCPKRHIQNRTQLTDEENQEFNYIKNGFKFYINKNTLFRWNTKKESSFDFHIHCQVIELGWFNKLIQNICAIAIVIMRVKEKIKRLS